MGSKNNKPLRGSTQATIYPLTIILTTALQALVSIIAQGSIVALILPPYIIYLDPHLCWDFWAGRAGRAAGERIRPDRYCCSGAGRARGGLGAAGCRTAAAGSGGSHPAEPAVGEPAARHDPAYRTAQLAERKGEMLFS